MSVGLARTGRWIVGRGVLVPETYARVPAELPETELDALLMETASPVGHARHLRPVVQLSETPGAWSRPPVPLGYHAPGWPPRGG